MSADRLTPYERRIAAMLAQGLTYRQAAEQLRTTEGAVQTATSRGVFRKLGVHTIQQLVRWWIYHVELAPPKAEAPREEPTAPPNPAPCEGIATGFRARQRAEIAQCESTREQRLVANLRREGDQV